jgi:putative addiction module component (TIGR02574 family)
MLTRDDVKTLTADQKLELMDLLSESFEDEQIPVSPEVRNEVESRLKTYDEDKKTAMPWRDALRRLTP